MNIINKAIVLKLNSAWQAVGVSTIGKAIVDLAAGQSANALDIEYEKDENGQYIVDADGFPCGKSTFREVDWETWITLTVREFDNVIHYGRDGSKVLRAPTILIAKNYALMPVKEFKGNPSKDAILIRDNCVDQYTGKKLRREDATIDHVVPRSKGGRNNWENLVTTAKKINLDKSNRFNHEVGLKLIRQPKAPRAVPVIQLIREIKHQDWKTFLPHLSQD